MLALALSAGVAAGCSSGSSSGGSETTEVEAEGPPSDAQAQQQAFDAEERALSTIRLPGAVGMFAKSAKVCPSGKAPQITRIDESSLPPSEVVSQLTTDLEDLGWQHESLPDGKERYTKDPYDLVVELAASDGGTTAEIQVTSDLAACP